MSCARAHRRRARNSDEGPEVFRVVVDPPRGSRSGATAFQKKRRRPPAFRPPRRSMITDEPTVPGTAVPIGPGSPSPRRTTSRDPTPAPAHQPSSNQHSASSSQRRSPRRRPSTSNGRCGARPHSRRRGSPRPRPQVDGGPKSDARPGAPAPERRQRRSHRGSRPPARLPRGGPAGSSWNLENDRKARLFTAGSPTSVVIVPS